MKQVFNKIAIVVVAIICFIAISCKKNDGLYPTTPEQTSYVFNGTTYTASNQLVVQNDSTFALTTKPNLSSGGFISYMYTNTKDTLYQYLFSQQNLGSASGDTIKLVILVSSESPLSTGIYPIIGGALSTVPTTTTTFATVSYSDTKNIFSDSTTLGNGNSIGSITLNVLNSTTGTLSGVFSFTVPNHKGNAPSTDTISSGQLINIPYQQF